MLSHGTGGPSCPSTPAASSRAGLVAEKLPEVQDTRGWEREGWLTKAGEVAECAEALSWLKQPKLVKPEEHKVLQALQA